MINKTGRDIEELMKKTGRPMHLKEIKEQLHKTRESCYTAIHIEEGSTFVKTAPATYYIKEKK